MSLLVHQSTGTTHTSSRARVAPGDPGAVTDTLKQLRAMSYRGLARMYSPADRLFVFRVRRTNAGTVQEGLSPRYTAISLIGLADATEAETAVALGVHTRGEVLASLVGALSQRENLGDIALTTLAAGLMGSREVPALVERLGALGPAHLEHPVVEIAWALSALSDVRNTGAEGLRDQIASRLMSVFSTQSELFPHIAGGIANARSHVTCFADLIYPIQALAKYAAATGNPRALEMSARCARRLCSLQGESGQWWWHYDYRTGRVLERYPVYAIHQDAMGPMGLFALMDAGGPDFTAEIRRGLQWLVSAPELKGGSLVDQGADLIWRKVARREPRKAVRYFQAAASRLHSGLRVPAVDALFPAGPIDFEDRPYHLGWLLYAWPTARVSSWQAPKPSMVTA